MRLVRGWLILSHRYLGIALGLMVMVWFASGMVMLYAGGMPQLSPDLRRERLAPLDTAAIRLSPTEAADRAGLETPERASLVTVLQRPAYRFGRTTVFADDGALLQPIDRRTAAAVAAAFLDVPAASLEYVGTVTRPDQWTLTLGRALPFEKFRTTEATEVYVATRTAEVVVATTSRDRLLAWLGVIPHWLYFAPLRLNQPQWYVVMTWLPQLALAATVLGLIVGLMRVRRVRPFRLLAAIPYAGWMRWHMALGLVFGLVTATWIFSGLVSMEPWAWTNARGLELDGQVLSGGQMDLSQFPRVAPERWAALAGGREIKEIELTLLQDDPYYVVRLAHPARRAKRERLHAPYPVAGLAEQERLIVSASTLSPRQAAFPPDSIVSRLQEAVPEARVVEQTLLTDYDDYYYSRRSLTPLPVLRVKFDDPMQTWIYVDPEMSRILAQIHRLNRTERWLYNGLHSLDFAFWYRTRAWDAGMILLCLGGLAASTIGTVLGLRRLGRGVRAAAPALPGAARPASAGSEPSAASS